MRFEECKASSCSVKSSATNHDPPLATGSEVRPEFEAISLGASADTSSDEASCWGVARGLKDLVDYQNGAVTVCTVAYQTSASHRHWTRHLLLIQPEQIWWGIVLVTTYQQVMFRT